VRVPFPFTDRDTSVNRPALVLSDAAHFNTPAGHSVMAMITSAGHRPWPLDTPIGDLPAAGLPAPSMVRCDACKAEVLLAFSCRTRYFCPSCHAKRLTEWTLWLGEELLAPVPHRQMVFTVPKRLRPYFLRRKLLGDLARVAARTATAFVRTTLDEPDLSVGIVLSIQTYGSLLNWQPHIHALVTDGGFRPDGTFVRLPAHSAEVLAEAFRRGVLKLFVEKDLFDPETAAGMLAWQHSGFSVHDGVWLDQDDAAAHERLARYCARCPVSLERLEYDAEAGTVTYTSDKAEGPTAGRHSFDAAEFIALLVAQIPDKGQVLQRYYGYYANRTRGERRKAQAAATAGSDGDSGEPTGDPERQESPELPEGGVTIVEPEAFSRGDARRRWAELIRLVYEVDPLACPRCGGAMRVIALIQEPAVIDKILRHLREKGRDARAGPWSTGPPGDGAGAEAA
jgi:hypothetical protein